MKDQTLILDFSENKNSLPQVTESWQREIIDFIKYYLSNDEIPVQTSGSTGKPKTYHLAKKAMQQSAALTADFLNLKKGDTALLCMPVSYIAGKMMIVRAIEVGMSLYCIPPKVHLHFPAVDRIDFAAFTPMQVEKSLNDFKDKIQFDKVILGGAKVSSFLEEKLKPIESDVYETYGMTETITHIAMRKLNQQNHFYTLPQIAISKNQENCLVIKTPYFDQKIETNDVVELMSDYEFKILGRKDHIINSGGLKINPEELEERLKPYIQVPFIVHHKPDPVLGQKVVLLLESDNPIQVDFPSDLIPKNKQPKEIIYLSTFPRTISGKIQRKKIEWVD